MSEYKLFCQHCDYYFYVTFDLDKENGFRCEKCHRLNKIHIEAIKRKMAGRHEAELFEPRINEPIDDEAIYCYWD